MKLNLDVLDRPAMKYAARIAYSTRETLAFTYEMAKKYADSPGYYIECGVAAGAQVIAMRDAAPNKHIEVFDSFKGIPLPSNRDDQMPGIAMLTEAERKALPAPGKQALISTGATVVSVKDFWAHIELSGVSPYNIGVNEGWFEESTKGWMGPGPIDGPPDRIAILRLDGDLYNSTLVCLENLYPGVMMGGLVIIDDWQLPGCRAAVEDYFFEMRKEYDMPEPEIKFVSNIAYFIK